MRAVLLLIVPALARLLIRSLGVTWRREVYGWPNWGRIIERGEPLVGGLFHGRQAVSTHFSTRPGHGPWTIMVSHSRDGDFQDAICRGLGFNTVRGSTGRGGARALVDLIRVMRDPASNRVAMAVDGSRGPIWHVKPGVLTLAVKSGAWLGCCGSAAERAWVLHKTWDRFTIPKPFTRVVLVFPPPVRLPPSLSPDAINRLRPRFQTLMDRARAIAEAKARRRGRR